MSSSMTTSSEKEEEEKTVEKTFTLKKNHWNREIEELAFHFKNSCLARKWMHNRMSSRHSIWNTILENLTTVMGICISMSIFTTAFYCSSTFEIQLICGLVSSMATIIDRIHSNLALDSSADDHKRIALRYGELYNQIDLQLRISTSERREAVFYIEWIQKMYNNLLEISPDIDSGTWKSYREHFPHAIQNSMLATENFSARSLDLSKEIREQTRGEQKMKEKKKSPKEIEQKKVEKQKNYESERMIYELNRYLETSQ